MKFVTFSVHAQSFRAECNVFVESAKRVQEGSNVSQGIWQHRTRQEIFADGEGKLCSLLFFASNS